MKNEVFVCFRFDQNKRAVCLTGLAIKLKREKHENCNTILF